MIYALLPDASHIHEEEEPIYDATLIEFEGYANAPFSDPEIDYRQRDGVPEHIEFVGKLEHVCWLDHVGTAPLGYLLLSRRMMRVLESISPFKYRPIPTVIYSEAIAHLVRDESTRRRTSCRVEDPRLRNDDFIILQLLEQIDCLDRERTMVDGVPFRDSNREFLGFDGAQQLTLREPDGGFPPVFCVPELLYYVFSEEAKQACDKAGLKGLWWRPQH